MNIAAQQIDQVVDAKVCTRCEAEKPLSEYYRSTVSRARPDGYYGNCKSCHREIVRASTKKRRALATLAEQHLPELLAKTERRTLLTALGLKWCGFAGGVM